MSPMTRWLLFAAALLLIVIPPSPDFLKSTMAIGFAPSERESVLLDAVAVLVGGLIVLLFFWHRFNEWPPGGETAGDTEFLEVPPSHCTTWGRYQVYHVFYIGIAIAIYLLLVRFPFLVEFVTGLLYPTSDARAFAEPGQKAVVDIQMSTTTAAGYAAAFMIGVWTSLPVLGERRLRAYCHGSAAVPREARNRIKRFHSGRSVFSPEDDAVERLMRSDVGEFLSEHSFQPDS